MSRENRRKAAATPTLERPAAQAPAAPQSQRAISWRHCLVGLVVGELLLLLLADGGSALANLAFGSSGEQRIDGGIVGVATFLSVLAGAYLAARLARRFELYQAMVVAVGFIAVSAMFQFGREASMVHDSLASGTHTLIDLGPMNMGSLMSGDLLALVAATFGAILARRRGAGPGPRPAR